MLIATMQNLSNHSAISLDDIDNDAFKRNGLPSFVYLAILCIIGIIGNFTVLIVYSLNYKSNSYKTFVLCLSTIDFIACVFCIPSDMYRVRHLYTVQSTAFCKISRTAMLVTGACSLALLDVIALERYRKVCQAHRAQFTVRTARIVCLVIVVVMVITAIPAIFVFGIQRHDTQYPSNVGYECAVINKYRHFTSTKIYFGVLSFIFILQLVGCVVLYSMIGRTRYKQRKQYQVKGKRKSVCRHFCGTKIHDGDRSSELHDQDSKQETEMTSRNLTEESYLNDDEKVQSSINELSVKILAEETGQNITETSPNNGKDSVVDDVSRRTKMFLVVSLISFGSYLPYMAACLLHIADSELYMTIKINDGYILVFIDCMFFLNNAINPLVYIFIDKTFQNYLQFNIRRLKQRFVSGQKISK